MKSGKIPKGGRGERSSLGGAEVLCALPEKKEGPVLLIVQGVPVKSLPLKATRRGEIGHCSDHFLQGGGGVCAIGVLQGPLNIIVVGKRVSLQYVEDANTDGETCRGCGVQSSGHKDCES